MSLSMFLVTGEVRGVFTQPGSVDRTTGEARPESLKVQILGELPVVGGGTREDIITLTIPEGLDFQPYLKQVVSVPVGFMSPAKGTIIYFIPKGSRITTGLSASPVDSQVRNPLSSHAAGVKSPLAMSP